METYTIKERFVVSAPGRTIKKFATKRAAEKYIEGIYSCVSLERMEVGLWWALDGALEIIDTKTFKF